MNVRCTTTALIALTAAAALTACSDGGSRTYTTTTAGVTSGTAGTTTQTGATPAGPLLPPTRSKTAQVVARYGEGFLELDQGQKLLHTKGTAYERGVQYGVLVGDEVEGLYQHLISFAQSQGLTLAPTIMQMLTPIGSRIFKSYFDADALAELRGILDGMKIRNPGSRIDMDDLVFINSIVDLGALVDLAALKCSGLAVWGSRTEGGKLFQTRCVDLLVGSGIEDNALVVMARPTGGVAYANPGWAGMIGCASGLNAHGVGISQVWAFSQDRSVGRPWILTMRELMIHGRSADDAVRLLGSDHRTYGSNFVFADRGDDRGGQPSALAVESSWNHMFVFGPDDPAEDQALYQGQNYNMRMPEAVFRGDCYINQTLRATQTASNGPSGDPRQANAYQKRYQGQADAIAAYANQGKRMGAQEVIAITQQVAMRRSSLQCNVYANSDLELWVANSARRNGQISYAYQEPYVQYSLDYYTPTLRLVPDSQTVNAGGSLNVAGLVETLGRTRGLDIHLTLEAGGQTYDLGRIDDLVLPVRGRVTGTTTIVLPAGVTAGAGVLNADLLEAGTTDLVDIARVDLTIQ